VEVNLGIPISLDDRAHYGQMLNRLKRMKERWRPAAERVYRATLFDSIRAELNSARAGTARSHFHWFGAREQQKMEDDTTLQLGYRDIWKAKDGRGNMKWLEFRHKSNVPHEFDKFDRPALESWMKSFDPMQGMDPIIRRIETTQETPLGIEGKTTAEIRRIADFKSYNSTYMAPPVVPDEQADAEIRAQLERAEADQLPNNVVDFRVDRAVDLEPDSSDVTVQPVVGADAKYVLMAPDDSVAEEAAAVANSIGQVVHK